MAAHVGVSPGGAGVPPAVLTDHETGAGETPAPPGVVATTVNAAAMRTLGRIAACAVTLLLGVGTACAPRSAAPAYELGVATWNIRWFPSGQPEPQSEAVERQAVEAAARDVRRAEPHILCIQEIRDRAAAEELAAAARLKGLRVVACSDFQVPEGSPGTQQLAILSNLPVVEAGADRWRTVGAVDPPRGYAYAVFDTVVGPVGVFCVHLKSNFVADELDAKQNTELNRLKRQLAGEQLLAATKSLRLRATNPVSRIIVAGDFNSSATDARWAGEAVFRGFAEEGFASCFDGMSPRLTQTLPATTRYPAATFDYVLHRGFRSQRETHVHPKRWVSDHRMVSVWLAP